MRPALIVCCAIALAAPAGASSLSDLLDEAVRHNPDVASAMHAWRAAAEVPSQVSTPPDPELSVQHLSAGSPRPFAGFTNSEFAYIGVGISQDIPYPGKLSLRAESAKRDAEMARGRYHSATAVLLEKVKSSYFQLAYIQKTLGLLDRDRNLLDNIEKIAEARYRLGQGTQQDVLKAQLQKTKILEDVAHHHQLMATQQALMTQLLNRQLDAQAISEHAISAQAITVDDITESPLKYTSDQLLAMVRAQNPEVASEQEMVRKQSLQVELARKDRYPDFNVQYQWEHTAGQFRDYYMLTFSAKVPIYRKRKLDPEMAQAASELNQARRDYESRVQQAYFDVRDQYIAAETASQMLKIYREGLIPQAMATFRAGLAAYESGGQDFTSLLASFLDVLNFDEEYWKALAEHETALARLERLTGASIR